MAFGHSSVGWLATQLLRHNAASEFWSQIVALVDVDPSCAYGPFIPRSFDDLPDTHLLDHLQFLIPCFHNALRGEWLASVVIVEGLLQEPWLELVFYISKWAVRLLCNQVCKDSRAVRSKSTIYQIFALRQQLVQVASWLQRSFLSFCARV